MKTRTTFTLVLFSIIAAVFAAGYFFSVSYINALGVRANKTNAEVQELEVKHARASSLSAIANSGKSNIEKLDDFIVKPGEEIGVVKTLEQLAKNLSLVSTTDAIDIQDIGSSSVKTKEFLHVVISTSGRWDSTRRFLTLLETLPYNIKENKVDLFLTQSGAGGASLWQGHFDISIVKNKDASSQ